MICKEAKQKCRKGHSWIWMESLWAIEADIPYLAEGPVTNGAPFEGDHKGRRLWRIPASGGIVEAHNAQTRPISLFPAFFCDCRPSRRRQRWIPIRTPV